MKKEIGAEPDIFAKLHVEPVRGIKRFRFILLEYYCFRDSEESGDLPRGLPWFPSPLALMVHIVKTRALALLGFPCYFVKLEKEIVGLFAIQEQRESLLVASLGIAKQYRRRGIGTCILGYIETIAERMGKRWLEVDAWRKNIPAQRLYTKYGFTFTQGGGMHSLTRGKKPV